MASTLFKTFEDPPPPPVCVPVLFGLHIEHWGVLCSMYCCKIKSWLNIYYYVLQVDTLQKLPWQVFNLNVFFYLGNIKVKKKKKLNRSANWMSLSHPNSFFVTLRHFIHSLVTQSCPTTKAYSSVLQTYKTISTIKNRLLNIWRASIRNKVKSKNLKKSRLQRHMQHSDVINFCFSKNKDRTSQ